MVLPSQTTVDLLETETRKARLQFDIFHCILDCLTAPQASFDQFSLELRRVLFSLAQTCRTFSGPSLDRLWSKLNSLEPLIQCFSGMLTEEKAKTPPSREEWVTFYRYSYRVKELVIDSPSEYSAFFLLSTSLHPFLLVPNLRLLRWSPNSCLSTPTLSITFIQRLLNPSLVSLSVALGDEDDVVSESFLTNLPILCPHLKSIHFNVDNGKRVSRTVIRAFSQAIVHYEHLEHVNVTIPINYVAFMHIAMSPRLENFIHEPDEFDFYQVHISPDAIPFRNVDDLTWTVWDLHLITTLLRTQDQKFRCIKLCHPQTTSEAIFAFFSALESPTRTLSLESITLGLAPFGSRNNTAEEYDELSPRFHISYDTLRPLASLCNLRCLVVELTHWFSINDSELISLARNWPYLESLRLGGTQEIQACPWRFVKYVTFKGLLSLLECCPRLRCIKLSVDARQVPVDTGNVVCRTALKRLSFPNSPIGDPRLVQDFLGRHFPSVTKVFSLFWLAMGDPDPEVRTYKLSWDKVNVHLRGLAKSAS